jgi:hypothetical protein
VTLDGRPAFRVHLQMERRRVLATGTQRGAT